jgi:glycosyltransferase involved in cell wall biosynthesis
VSAWVRAGRPPVLHLHWTHEYLKGADGPTRLNRARFLGQLRFLRRLGVRLVWTMHNLGGHDGVRHASEMTVHRDLVRLADAVICHCTAARDAAIAAYGLTVAEAARLHVIPHGSYVGVYPDTITSVDARARLGLPPVGPALLFLGAVRGYKGTDDLVAAFRTIAHPDARLLIAGRPRGAGIVERLTAAAATDPRIHLSLGFVPDAELQVWLRAADLVVLPFRDILTSGSAILALSFGRPVVAPALGCLPETVPPTAGILYDPDTPGALGDALRAALDGDLASLGEGALAQARELDWGPIAEHTAALYRG